MEYHSYAAYDVFLRFSEGLSLRRAHKLFMVEYVKCSDTNIYHNPKDWAPNWPIPAWLESCTQSQTQKVTTVTKMAPWSHPTLVIVGTFETAKGQNDDSHEGRRCRAFMPTPQTIPRNARLYIGFTAQQSWSVSSNYGN